MTEQGYQSQSASNLEAEVEFRKYHDTSYKVVLDYLKASYRQRAGRFGDLLLREIPLTPFLELGCETGINGMILTNRLGQSGYSIDISLDSLIAMERYREELGLERTPIRVCCDIGALPFHREALSMALAWGTLHHFPDPRVPLVEVRRVLKTGGLVYFDGEPVRRQLSLNLKATRSIHQMNRLELFLLKCRILPWLRAIDGGEAIEAGALEMKFSAWQWKRFFSEVFESVQFRWSPELTGDMRSVSTPVWWLIRKVLGAERAPKAASALGGGVVYGEARKQPERLLKPVMSTDGRSRYLLRKPAGNDRLLMELKEPLAKPVVRIAGTQATGLTPVEGRKHWYECELEAPEVHAGLLDVEIIQPENTSLISSLYTDGPHGKRGEPFSQKETGPVFDPAKPFDLLACPECRNEQETPALIHKNDALVCDGCGEQYPIVEGIPVLVTKKLRSSLGYA